jgi:hypothetical protein
VCHVWQIREVCTGLWWGDLNERHLLEDLGSGMGRHGLDYLAQDRERLWALVNSIMNLTVPQNGKNFSSSWRNC